METSIPEHLQGYFDQQQFRLSYGIHKWYHKLQDHTFQTSFIELPLETLKALLACCEKGGIEKKSSLSESEQALLSQLEVHLDDEIRNFGEAFVKLDSRSPKDTCFDSAEFAPIRNGVIQNMRSELSKLGKIELNSQQMLDTFMRCLYQNMKVTNGKEALYLLCGSARVREDLQQVPKLYPYGLRNRICVRKWDSYVAGNPQCEFRGFVYKNKLTAVSQYDYMSLYPQIVSHKSQILQQIVRFFEEVLQKADIGLESYIADFFVGEKGWRVDGSTSNADGDVGEVCVVELNSFESWTGACLFTWGNDREVLLNGPLEFRIVEKQPVVLAEDYIPSKWLEIVQQELGEFLQAPKSEVKEGGEKSSSNCVIS